MVHATGSCEKVFVIAFHASITNGCDYAIQTMKELAKRYTVIGFALGEPINWKNIFRIHSHALLVEKKQDYVIFRPFFIIPGQRFFGIKKFNFFLNALVLRFYVSLLYPKHKKYFWFFEPFFMPQMLRIFSSYISLFDCVDYFLDIQKKYLPHLCFSLKHATHVFVNSKVLKKQLSPYRSTSIVVPLGFSDDLFIRSRYTKKKSVGVKRIGFVGGIDDRLDYQLLYKTASALKEIPFVLVGKNYFSHATTPPLAQAFFSLPNVHVLPEQPKKNMPDVIRSFSICMIPYDIRQRFNLYCFPMKVLEYFYYGKPVITTDIHELRRFKNELIIVRSPNEFIKSVRGLIQNDWPAEVKKSQQAIAISNAWKEKIRVIEREIFLPISKTS